LREAGCLTFIAALVLGVPVHYVIRWIEKWLGLPEGPWDLLVLMPGLVAAPLFVAMYIVARVAYRREIQEWSAQWICLRCGHRWMPEGKSE
jgi:predicted PurR-regulated permease PerM